MIFFELATRSRSADEEHHDEVDHVVVFFTQPVLRRARAWAYHRFDTAVAGLPLRTSVERVLARRHRRGCRDDCTAAVSSTGEDVKVCGYLPLTCRQDLRCYALSQRGRTDVCSAVVSRQTYESLRPRT